MTTLPPRHFGFTNAKTLWNMAFLLTLFVYAAGLFITIMEPDAAVYAEISMEMFDSGDFLSIFHKGADWLDKPHFPFWMTAISYSIFGVSAFAYKLPGIAFTLLGAWYTFRFGKHFYSPKHGYIASLILMTSQHIIISNQDVRAEPFMTGLLIMALYHLALYLELTGVKAAGLGSVEAGRNVPGHARRLVLHGFLACTAMAALIMTKGMFTIIPLVAGVGFSMVYARRWKSIFHWRWLVFGLLTLALMFPALYGYYRQFDLHPEKKIFGQTNVSGVEFFLWTSQWGRFTNTGPIKGRGDLFFFVHTTLWAFLPWAFLAFFALYNKSRALVKKISTRENYTYFGFMALFLVFSVSKFQLSFYLNPIFPLLSIVSADALLRQKRKTVKVFSVMHLVVCCLLVAGLCLLHFFFMDGLPHIDTLILLLAGVSVSGYLFSRRGMFVKKIIFATLALTLSVNYYVNRDFYPALLKYQSESEAAYYMKAKGLPADKLAFTGDIRSVQDIILHHVVPVYPLDQVNRPLLAGKYVYTNVEGQAILDSLGLKYSLLKTFDDFHVTMLTGKFINKKTRDQAVVKNFLLKVE